jgi:hypothetical protein
MVAATVSIFNGVPSAVNITDYNLTPQEAQHSFHRVSIVNEESGDELSFDLPGRGGTFYLAQLLHMQGKDPLTYWRAGKYNVIFLDPPRQIPLTSFIVKPEEPPNVKPEEPPTVHPEEPPIVMSKHVDALLAGQEVFLILGGGEGDGMPMDAGASISGTVVKLQRKMGYSSETAIRQLWTFVDGYIVHKTTGLVLDGANASAVSLQEKKAPSVPSQQWTIEGINGHLVVKNAGIELRADGPNRQQENFYSPGSNVCLTGSTPLVSFRRWYVLAPSLRRPIVATSGSLTLTSANFRVTQTGHAYPLKLVFGDDRYLWYADTDGRLINDATLDCISYDYEQNIAASRFQPSTASSSTTWIPDFEHNQICTK